MTYTGHVKPGSPGVHELKDLVITKASVGEMDNNVPPYNTYLMVDALIKANKEFDLLMIPNAPHGYGAASNYTMRRRWDYFVKHLLGVEPPKEYELKPPPAAGGPGS